MSRWTLPAPRILIAIGVTAAALVGLALGAMWGGSDESDDSPPPTTSAETTTTDDRPATMPSIEVQPDWYPKRMSRYSDRQPAVTVTTLASTTLPGREDEPGTGGGSNGGGSSGNGAQTGNG